MPVAAARVTGTGLSPVMPDPVPGTAIRLALPSTILVQEGLGCPGSTAPNPFLARQS